MIVTRKPTPDSITVIICALVVVMIALSPAAPVTSASTAIATAAPTVSATVNATVQADPYAEVDTAITSLMRTYDIPGVSIAIVRDGKVALTRGYGVRDTKTGAKVDTKTSFALGSVTKSFTTLGIQLLAAEGKVDLDKPVITYLPDLKLSDAAAQQTITLRQLLSHTSGLSPADTGSQVLIASEVSRAEYLKAIEKLPLVAQPGTTFRYANQNFVLAGLVIEKITGKSWEEFTRERIFGPLGMVNAGFDAVDLLKSPDAAVPHDLDVLQGMIPVDYTQNLTAIGPAGSANASAEDMAQYALFQLDGSSADGKLKISKALLAEMHTPVIALTGDAAEAPTSAATAAANTAATPDAAAPTPLETDQKYALGWFTETYRGLPLIQHGGNVVGYTSNITLIPSKGTGIVILTNANYANLFIDAARLRLVEIATGLPSERDLATAINAFNGFDAQGLKDRLAQARTFKVNPADLDKLTGTYGATAGKIIVTAKEGKLYALPDQTGLPIELVPFMKDAFLGNTFPFRGNRFTFITDSKGTTIVMGPPDGGLTFGFRPAAGQLTKTVSDPDKLYTLEVPAAFVVQTLFNFQLIVQPSPQLVMVASVYPIEKADPLEDLDTQNRKLDPNFKDKPISTTKITVKGVEWTQYDYALPSGQVSINYVTRKGKNNYYFGYAAAKTDLPALQPIIDAAFQSFVINEK
jgi:CubicO group peptidase (beta-lactamase class C family)